MLMVSVVRPHRLVMHTCVFQVRELECRHLAQLAAAASQLSAVRARQEALGGAILGVMAQQQQHKRAAQH